MKFCEFGNDTLGFVKGEFCFGQLSDCQLFKEGFFNVVYELVDYRKHTFCWMRLWDRLTVDTKGAVKRRHFSTQVY